MTYIIYMYQKNKM